jgi:predicted metal-binding protein
MNNKKYIIVIQCHIVKEHCSGYVCENTFHNKNGMFSRYKENQNIRFLPMTCGRCCGRAVNKKLMDLIKTIKRKEKIEKTELAVHLSSCIITENYHGYPCPHKEYLKNIITKKLKLDLVEGSYISQLAEKKREKGIYQKRK